MLDGSIGRLTTHSNSLLRYSGGGLGRGFGGVAHLLHNPLPSPPPEYRGREKRRSAACVMCAVVFAAMVTSALAFAQTHDDSARPPRTKEAILAEISANSLPAIDVPAMADAAYAKQITAQRGAAAAEARAP